jgi:hypothetical protein
MSQKVTRLLVTPAFRGGDLDLLFLPAMILDPLN